MRFVRCVLTLVCVGLLAGGCDQGKPQAAPLVVAQKAAPAAAEPAARSTSPPNEYRRMLTQQALRGLLYDSGRVAVDRRAAREIVRDWDRSQAAAEHRRGTALLNRNRVLEAIKAHTRAVLLDSKRAEYYEGLGTALLVKRKLAEAEAALRSALDRKPELVSARFKLADVLNRRGDSQAAIAQLEEVLRLDPQHAAAHSRLAISLYYAGRTAEARSHADAASDLGFQVPPQFEALLAGQTGTRARPGGVPPLVGPQVRVDLGNPESGNETSAASLDYDPSEVVATWNDYRTDGVRMGVALSLDGGKTWEDFVVRPPTPYQASTEGDPMTAYDNRTGHLWVGAIAFSYNGGVYVARKNPGESEFLPSVMAKATSGADKGWMAAGTDPFDPQGTRMYIAYNQGVLTSTDLGDTWSGPKDLSYGLGFLPRIGPNGELYIAYWDVYDGNKLYRSFDGGNTFEGPFTMATRMDVWSIDGTRFPGKFRVPPLTYLAVDPNSGDLYCVYFDTTEWVGGNRNVDLYFCKSTDQGTTWTTPVVINGDGDPPGDQFFPWLEVDETGRIHMLFYDTRAVDQDDGQSPAWIEAYYSYSDDGGDTWHEIKLSEAPFSSADDGFGDGFIGDYLGMGIGQRYAYPSYLSTHEGMANIYVNAIYNQPTISPLDFELVRGVLISGGLDELYLSDDARLVAQAGIVLEASEPPVWIVLDAQAPEAAPQELKFALEAMASTPGLTQRVELYNYDSESFEEVDARAATTSDSLVEVVITDNPARFIDPETLQVSAQVTWKATAPVTSWPWQVRVDQVYWFTTE